MSIRTRKFMASAAAALAAGALAGPAVAGTPTPSDEEYGDPLSEEASGGSEGTLGAEATSGDLPFTGFEAIAVLAGGIGLASAGLVLRRVSRARS